MGKIVNIQELNKIDSIIDGIRLKINCDIDTLIEASNILIHVNGSLKSPMTVAKLSSLLFSQDEISKLEQMELAFSQWQGIVNEAMTIAVSKIPEGISVKGKIK